MSVITQQISNPCHVVTRLPLGMMPSCWVLAYMSSSPRRSILNDEQIRGMV